MASEVINKYINERYERWLDYSRYHCTLAGIPDEALDVLNEVLAMLIEKYEVNPDQITRLYEKVKGEYRELDFFVLQMIKLNIISPTSPYQHKYGSILVDDNVDFRRIELEDEEYEEPDDPERILTQMQKIRDIVDNSYLSDLAKCVFFHKFFDGCSFSEWEGPEDKKLLYDLYNGVMGLIKNKLNGRELF